MKQELFRKLLKRVLTTVTALILLTVCTACSNAGLTIVNSLASLDDFNAVENIPYGQHPLNRLSVYSPKQLPAGYSNPTIVFFYGGCWGGCETLNKEEYLFVAQALTAQGFTVVIPDYRRHPEVKFATIMQDAARSVQWVKDHIADYGGNPGQLFLMGHSAGAHIAAMLTLDESYLSTATYRAVKGFIGLAGPYDFLPFTDAYQKVVFGPKENYPNTQPVNFVDGTEPPLLLLYGNDDHTVKPINIESLTRIVKRQGGCVESFRYKDLDHAELLGALSIPLRSEAPVLANIVGFVKKNVANHKTCHYDWHSTRK